MARLLNLIIVILEIIAFAKVSKRGGGLKKGLTFYTIISNLIACAPLGAPQSKFADGTVPEPGRWYVMPTFRGDHMAFQGGLTKRINIKPFYLELAKMISEL